MRLSDLNLNESITFKNGEEAETTCEFLKACKIPFKKEMRTDGTGADFTLKNFAIAKKALKGIKTSNKKICKNFDLVLDKGSNTIKVYFK
jgi:hypothetical protein